MELPTEKVVMARPEIVLSPSDHSNYRNIRAVALLFVVLGSIFTIGGLAAMFVEPRPSEETLQPLGRDIQRVIGIFMGVAGLAGLLGGIAVLVGNRRWAPLAYVMASLYVFGFPLGTILSCVMFLGLGRYLDSVDRIRDDHPE